jgi:hypothetical protein
LFAIGNRKFRIAIAAVPVVQRIEQGFPNAKTAFLLESPNDIRSIQIAVFEVVQQLLPSSRVITNLPIFRVWVTQRVTQISAQISIDQNASPMLLISVPLKRRKFRGTTAGVLASNSSASWSSRCYSTLIVDHVVKMMAARLRCSVSALIAVAQ